MCGIWGYLRKTDKQTIDKLFKSFMNVKNRGPDRSDFKVISEFIEIFLGFHRLAIMDRSTYGDQPFTLENHHNSIYVMCNGEIYNHLELTNKYNIKVKSKSDCEMLPELYNILGFDDMIRSLRGEFAICVIDIDHEHNIITMYLGRDPLGVRPIFVAEDNDGIGFSSTLAGIDDIFTSSDYDASIHQMRGGQYIKYVIDSRSIRTSVEQYYDLNDYLMTRTIDAITNTTNTADPLSESFDDIFNAVRTSFIEAVTCRMESDRPLAALLSGGLDSSLIVSIGSKYLRDKGKILKTFSVGIPGSTDLEYALLVSKHCKTDHTHVEFTEQEFINAIPDVIKAIETYDITTVRASTGQYLLSKWIADNTDYKVLLIGDGSDELLSGYMYFHNAPDPITSHNENIRLLNEIIYFDVLRADRGIAFNGLEARVPFLDHIFVSKILSLDPELRIPRPRAVAKTVSYSDRNIEKWLLRSAFSESIDNMGESWLPDKVLWRKKEAFSDGVSSKTKSWYQIIQDSLDISDTNITNMMNHSDGHKIIPHTKEAAYYKYLYSTYYKTMNVFPHYWLPKWSGDVTDPSARVLSVYEKL